MIENSNQTKDILNEYDTNSRLYTSFLSEIEHQLKSILSTSQINYNAITSRLKTKESLSEKIERKQNKYGSLSDITDIAGVRIITYYSNDVDKIAEIIESEFDVDKDNSIDKRESLEPDRFGYCSVHYVVKMSPQRLALRECAAFKNLKCEIQIRSVLQHAWAEIEHDIGYKSEITVPKEMRRNFSRIAGLLEIADKEFNQIRMELDKYKADAKKQITDDSFIDKELDAVILEVLINTNSTIQAINNHIADLFGEKPEEIEDSESFESTIYRFNWLGIKTVRQLNDTISKYGRLAMDIASIKLKDYQRDPTSNIRKTVAFFYLCYAVLLTQYNNESIYAQYFDETHIGLPSEHKKIAKEFLHLREQLNIPEITEI